jgi:hypothetical protein
MRRQAKDRVQALYLAGDPILFSDRIPISTLAPVAHMPTITVVRDYVDAGGLMSYEPDYPGLFQRRRLGRQDFVQDKAKRDSDRAVDQISTGRKPQDRRGAWLDHPQRCLPPLTR